MVVEEKQYWDLKTKAGLRDPYICLVLMFFWCETSDTASSAYLKPPKPPLIVVQ